MTRSSTALAGLLLAALGSLPLAASAYTANLNQDPRFQLRRQADAAFLAGRYEEAQKAYRQLLEQSDDLDSLYQLGLMLDRGLGGKAKPEEASALLQRAAEAGHPPAMRALAAQDPSSAQARTWLQRAAEAGDARAAALLAEQVMGEKFPNRARAVSLARAAEGEALGELLLGMLEIDSAPETAARRWHALLRQETPTEAIARRAAWLLANFYQRRDHRQLAYFWLQIAPDEKGVGALPTRYERDLRLDRGTLRSLLEQRQRDIVEAAAKRWEERLVSRPDPARDLHHALAARDLPCENFDKAIDIAVAAARVGRTGEEIQTDVQNYLPLRDASLSAQSARLDLAQAVFADFSQLEDIALPHLRAMIIGKCLAGGYLPERE